MFRKSSVNKQFGLFSTPSTLMCKRESKQYDDELEWHSQFFRNVICNIDEEVFRPLYTEKHFGAPTKHIRQLVAMNILKEGAGCSDEQMLENCRYNLLWHKALGLFSLDDECPSQASYYLFRGKICEYERTSDNHVNLFEECFKKLTAAQVKTYKVSGRVVRMDSKLISSNIAWYSRYEIIHETLVKSTTDEDVE
ncbi:MAG: transposase, partial [Prevotellaceae bacterium]|nr:transposase [Candidatus Colivivens equi]